MEPIGNILPEQIASFSSVVEDAVVRLLEDAGRATELLLDRKVVFVFQTAVS